MANEFQPLQGMNDIASPDILLWQNIEEEARQVFKNFGYFELRTPILEKAEVFVHTLGDSSDIVQKEMYNLKDRGGRSLVLRPEGTAGAIRYLSSLGEESENAKVYYIGPMFRCERPQAGRKRQFHQIGAESICNPNPLKDVETIALQYEMLNKLGLKINIKINTLGSIDDQINIRNGLTSSLEKYKDILSPDYKSRLENNVLRILDSKDQKYQNIIDDLPSILTFMNSDSRKYLDTVMKLLEELKIPYKHDPRLVRGLDYYNHTVWEITHDSLGSQDSVAGGGRYTIKSGKKMMNGVGFAMGIERIILALNVSNKISNQSKKNGFWIISLGDESVVENMKLAKVIRNLNKRCGMDLDNKSMKAQFRKADRFGALEAIIRGDDELTKGIIIIKNLDNGEQNEYNFNQWLVSLKGVQNASI